MTFDRLNLATIPAPQRPDPSNDERIPVNDDTRGEAHHVEAIRAHIAQLHANREATPVPMHPTKRGHAL